MHRMVYEINHPTSKKLLIYFGSAIAQLDWAIQGKELDYPVNPDNDNRWKVTDVI